jgi:site-specific DNA-methyltransferase (adenine-specific)
MARREQASGQIRCENCRRAITRASRGRPPRYCGSACRQAAYRRRRDGEQKRGLVRLYEGDAREFLAGLPDESVDLIVTDPPYVFDRGGSRHRQWFDASIGDSQWPEVFAELYRVLAVNCHAYVFADRRVFDVFQAAAIEAGFRSHTPIVWDKITIGLGHLYRAQHEWIGVIEKGSRPGNFKNLGDVQRARRVVGGYPTEKPVELLRTLIRQSSDPGQVVLDPFCGSGSTGAAARSLRRRSVLCDVVAAPASTRLRIGFESAVRTQSLRNQCVEALLQES